MYLTALKISTSIYTNVTLNAQTKLRNDLSLKAVSRVIGEMSLSELDYGERKCHVITIII